MQIKWIPKRHDPGLYYSLQTSRCSVVLKASFPSTLYLVPDKQMFCIKGHISQYIVPSSRQADVLYERPHIPLPITQYPVTNKQMFCGIKGHTLPSTQYPVTYKQMFCIKGHTLPPAAASSQDDTTPPHKVHGNQESLKSFQDIQIP